MADQTQARLAAEEIQALPYNRETDDASLYCDHIAAIIEKHTPTPPVPAAEAGLTELERDRIDMARALADNWPMVQSSNVRALLGIIDRLSPPTSGEGK